MSKRTSSYSETVLKRQCVEDISLKEYEDFFMKSSDPSKKLFAFILSNFENNVPINFGYFKYFFNFVKYPYSQREYNPDKLNHLLNHSNFKEKLPFFFDNFYSMLSNNKENSDLNWAITFITFFLTNCSRADIIRYSPKFIDLVENSMKNSNNDVKCAYKRINVDIIYPYLHLLYEYDPEEEISTIALIRLSEREYLQLCEIHGDDFILNSLCIIIEKYVNYQWTVHPIISEKLKKNIMYKIDSIIELNNFFQCGFLTIEDAYEVMKYESCKLNYEESYLRNFVNLFKESDSIYGKFARAIKTKNPNNYLNLFQLNSNYTIQEQIQLIKYVIPINQSLLFKIKNFEVFKEAIYHFDYNDFFVVILYNNIKHPFDISNQDMRKIIYNYIDLVSKNLLMVNPVKYILEKLSYHRITFSSLYMISDFILENKQECLTHPIFIEWYLLSCGMNGIDVSFNNQEEAIINSRIANFQLILNSVLTTLRQNQVYIKLTNRMYWIFHGTFHVMDSFQSIPDIDDSNFTENCLVWNKINTVFNYIEHKKYNHVCLFKLVNAFNSFLPERTIDVIIYGILFSKVLRFSNKYTQGKLSLDLLKNISKESLYVLKDIRCKNYVIDSILSKISLKDIKRKMSISVSQRMLSDEECVELKKQPNSKDKLDEIKQRFLQNEIEKEGLKECIICMDNCKHFVKLPCECKYDFCKSCITELRISARSSNIKCPTCRKITSIIYNKSLAA